MAGRKGLSARSPSPPPIRNHRRTNPDYLPPERLEELENEAEGFRGSVARDYGAREAERKAAKAREILVERDTGKGVRWHPLHADPSDPLALPRPLLRLIYPEYAGSPEPEVEGEKAGEGVKAIGEGMPAPTKRVDMSAAARLREQMRRDMLSELGGEEEGVRFSIAQKADALRAELKAEAEAKEGQGEEPNWQELASGTKRVLNMTVSWGWGKADNSLRRILRSSCRSCGTSICSASGVGVRTLVGRR